MGGNHSTYEDSELHSHMLLAKAHFKRKANLKHQINQLKIRSCYVRFNFDFKSIRETLSISKKLIKRIEALRKTKSFTSRLEKSAKMYEIVDHCSKSYDKIKVLDVYNCETTQDYKSFVGKGKYLEGVLDKMRSKLARMQEIYKENKEKIRVKRQGSCVTRDSSGSGKEDFWRHRRTQTLKNDSQGFSLASTPVHKLNFSTRLDFNSFDEEILAKNSEIMFQQCFNISKSIQDVKSCLKLPDKTLQLRSKLLLKEEMQRNIECIKQRLEWKLRESNEKQKALEENKTDSLTKEIDQDYLEHLNSKKELLRDRLLSYQSEMDYLTSLSCLNYTPTRSFLSNSTEDLQNISVLSENFDSECQNRSILLINNN
ncbi:hypothetical protein SteCoe_16502 [Stentor coeruleus]|uniref:Uncharacterized protein n=1 Tax=Stentor coeruleus TaxID=5963 RepID=A0A1R2C137_9CILI|nr:hypothetical protein SteCoe_16502 [Stentor coeruleus]